MPETKTKTVSMSNTKKEILEAYEKLITELKEKEMSSLSPQKEMEEKRMSKLVTKADSLSAEGVVKETNNLKLEIGKILDTLANKLETEVHQYGEIQKAIEIKKNELQEIYEIEKESATLAALIEAQNQKRAEFEKEIAEKKETLMKEIEATREQWNLEKEKHEKEIKERTAAEIEQRKREKEEYDYDFTRQKLIAKDKFEDEKAKLKKELTQMKETSEKELAEIEEIITEKEAEFIELKKKVEKFPKELDESVKKAIKETKDKIDLEYKYQFEMKAKVFEGERNLLNARITAFEKLNKEQTAQIASLSEKLEKSYEKIQSMAEKAIEGASKSEPVNIQQLLKEMNRQKKE